MIFRILATLAVLAVGSIVTTLGYINTPIVNNLVASSQFENSDIAHVRMMAALSGVGWVITTLTVSGGLILFMIWWGPVRRWLRGTPDSTGFVMLALVAVLALGVGEREAKAYQPDHGMTYRQSRAKVCLPATAPKTKSVYKDGKLANSVLCCCRTSGGGQCCNYVAFCSNFVPGCFCSLYHKPYTPGNAY
jgi:hypothetical protein